ncbi:MAG TPA: hypothetical protein VIW24_28455 [Aldersonia sp.]
MTLPVIDLCDPDVGTLREATHDFGFCYLVGQRERLEEQASRPS